MWLTPRVTGRAPPSTPSSRRRSTPCGPTYRSAPSCSRTWSCSPPRSTTSTPRSPPTPTCRYSRIEILAAFGIGTGAKIAAWQSGIYEAKDANAELFAFTLDKTSGSFSPHHPLPRLRPQPHPHPLGEPVDQPDSSTGLRYRNHERDGRSIMLFTRLRAHDWALWFLGPARYLRHEGEKPMAITWELPHPLPGDL